MKLIIAGSRTFTDAAFMEELLDAFILDVSEVVCGKCRGADTLGEQWAILHNIPVKAFPADWNRYGKSAGFRRNEQMAEYADTLAAFWDGKSRGTQHMIRIMRDLKKPVYILSVSANSRL